MLRQQWETELAKIPQLAVDEEMRTHQEQVETELTQINKGSVSTAFIVYYHCFVSFMQHHIPVLVQ